VKIVVNENPSALFSHRVHNDEKDFIPTNLNLKNCTARYIITKEEIGLVVD